MLDDLRHFRAEASDFPQVSADLAVFLMICGFVLGYILGAFQ